ncbi:MAG: leucine-rich repeat domain-containing protein, partial [Clostridia bacterium]|nr:leucine-rich repeat domain-containing protein [Clostridia bacterium]
MKKLLILLLSIISVICLCMGLSACGSVSDGDSDNSYEFEYTLMDDGTYSISLKATEDNVLGDITGSIVIPSEYKGAKVTAIGSSGFSDCSQVTGITIPDTITTIGDYAFNFCMAITEITIPDSVTTIGDYAFYYCSSLTEISLPDSVVSIGDYAFSLCLSLESVTIGKGVKDMGDYVFYDSYAITEIYYNAVEINSFASYNNVFNIGYGLDMVFTIGADVKYIPDYMFFMSYEYSDDGSYSYTNEEKITEIVFEEGSVCGSIGCFAFGSLSKLLSITIPDSVTYVGERAFLGCNSLTTLSIPFLGSSVEDTNNSYLGYLFGTVNYWNNVVPSSLKQVTVSGGLYIGDNAFENCTSVTSITLSDSIISIGNNAFAACNSLESVYYNGTASEWASISFANSTANPLFYAGNLYLNGTIATDITLENITAISAYAFYGCTSLTSVTFADTSGWYITTSLMGSIKIYVDVTDAAKN